MASLSSCGEVCNQEFESLSVSKRLVKSMSQKWKTKCSRSEGCVEDSVSLSCLPLYSRGGGCKVGADTAEEFVDTGFRRRSSVSDEGRRYTPVCGDKEASQASVDCFSFGMREKFFFFKSSQRKNSLNLHLPDEILEMCLVRLPLRSLMNARLVCKKWRNLTTTRRFIQTRRECLFQTPWLFLFGVVKDGFCLGEIHALDVSLNEWHKIDSPSLKGRFLFSVSSFKEKIYIVGGRSNLANSGRLDRSSFKTHRGVLVFNPLTKTSYKASPMKHARSSPILGVFKVDSDCLIMKTQAARSERHFYRSRVGGVSDVYEDPHRLSVRRQSRSISPHQFVMQKQETSKRKDGEKKLIMIAVGGFGSWNEPLDSCEIYDPTSDKWSEIKKLPLDFGVASSGVVCNAVFYAYSETDKLAAYDIEKGYWSTIHTITSPPRVQEYLPKLVSCKNRVLMVSVSWCEGEGRIGRRNKAVRKVWELDLMEFSWKVVSTHPDAPMDWNAAFVAHQDLIFGVEMFKIFGQVLDFVTMFEVCDEGRGGGSWKHVPRNHEACNLDASSCITKSMAVLHL